MLQTLAAWIWPASPWLLALAIGTSLAAGVLRGFAGFGYSAVVVAALAAFVVPGPLVIALLLLELLASARMLATVSADVDRSWLAAILLGNLLFVPAGVMALAWLDPKFLRVLISASILAGALFVKVALARPLAPSVVLKGATGSASGLLNGLAGSGGIVAALLMAASGTHPRVLRATIVSALFWMSAYCLLWAGVVSQAGSSTFAIMDAARWILILLVPMQMGIRVGNHFFLRSNPHKKQVLVVHVLIFVAILGTATALARLLTVA